MLKATFGWSCSTVGMVLSQLTINRLNVTLVNVKWHNGWPNDDRTNTAY